MEDNLRVLYEDRLDGTVTKEFYSQRSKNIEKQIIDLDDKIGQYISANIDYYQTGINILELAEKASFLYENATSEEKQELLNYLLSNSTLRDKKLLITYKKPFDIIYQRALSSDWRRMLNEVRTFFQEKS